MPLDNAGVRDVQMEPYKTVLKGIDCKVTVDLQPTAGGDFAQGDYLLDIEPREVFTVRNVEVLAPANIAVAEAKDHPEDRVLKMGASTPTVSIRLSIGTANVNLEGPRQLFIKLKQPPDGQPQRTIAERSPWIHFASNVPSGTTKTISSKDVVATEWTDDVVLSAIIKKGLAGMAFSEYKRYMDFLLCGETLREFPARAAQGFANGASTLPNRRFLPFNDTDAYRLLKVATEAFVAVKSAVCPKDAVTNEELKKIAESINASNLPNDPLDQFATQYLRTINGTNRTAGDVLPYYALIHQKLKDYPLKESIFANVAEFLGDTVTEDEIRACHGVLLRKLTCPIMIELIWSYWHEQGMQQQSMFAIRDRFQNRRSGPAPDPLAAMELTHLRPLNNIFWGYIQDEQHRLTLTRRCYEYDHHYGLTLQGKAVPPIQPVDSRGKFLEAFHNLLYLCTVFFKEDDDTNRKADAFPVLNAIKEVHFLLSEGAHNQYGDLPTTARIEMLLEQWLLARPEMTAFLPSRDSIAYPEPWMGPVDSMKTIQGWTNTSVMYFHDLAVFGEQILLSIRFNNWSEVFERTNAANWARIWRSEIQAYMHAYRTVTGVDLTVEPNEPRVQERKTDPSILILRRFEEQRRLGTIARGGMRLPSSPSAGIQVPQPRLLERR